MQLGSLVTAGAGFPWLQNNIVSCPSKDFQKPSNRFYTFDFNCHLHGVYMPHMFIPC